MRSRRGVHGQALAEFALVFPLFLLILMGIVDFGRAIYAYNVLSNASRAAVRVAIVDQNSAHITSKAQATAIGLAPSEIGVTTSPSPACGAIGCDTSVTVTYQWRALTPIVSNVVGPIHLSSTTTMQVERVYTAP